MATKKRCKCGDPKLKRVCGAKVMHTPDRCSFETEAPTDEARAIHDAVDLLWEMQTAGVLGLYGHRARVILETLGRLPSSASAGDGPGKDGGR